LLFKAYIHKEYKPKIRPR